jgi:hypothetical protein
LITCPSVRRFAAHLIRSACARAVESEGSKIAINSAMMPITISSSTSVNARGIKDEG